MKVDVKSTSLVSIDIESEEAFRLLCKTLYMDYVLDEDREFYIIEKYGIMQVWENIPGRCNVHIDDNGELFIALRNVAVNMFPNVAFRNADYIYNK